MRTATEGTAVSNPMTDHPTRPDLDKWEALASEADYTGYTMFLPTPAEMRQMVAYVRHLQSERDAALRRERITDGRGGVKPYYSAYGITIYCICKGGSA